ncbi:MAG: hypothetical protein WC489_04230 [Patescibacteria group bacterium]
MLKRKRVYKIILFVFLISQFQLFTLFHLPVVSLPGTSIKLDPHKLSLLNPATLDSAGLSSASATLVNPRLSFYGVLDAAVSRGGSVFVVENTGTYADEDTQNLFPNDNIAIGINGNMQVGTVSADLLTFTTKSGLSVTTAAAGAIYATQSGILRVRFYTGSAVPVGGSIKVAIPAPSTNPNDGAPNTAATIQDNGFDANGLAAAQVTCPGGFTGAAFTAGAGGPTGPHTVTCNWGGAVALPAGADLTVEIGNASKGLINPAPLTAGHTRGVADIYTFIVTSNSSTAGGGTAIESVDVKAAPVEGVLVTATVDETLSFTVAGLVGGTRCGVASNITTTATAVPWGIINSNYGAGTNNAAQQLTVTTNAPSGYNVYAEENDQMGKDGNTCTGAAPSAGDYTFGTGTCIKDYSKGGATHTTAADWTVAPGTDYGFGYSLANATGTDARFLYNDVGAFYAKQFADQEVPESKYDTNADLMYNAGPVSGSSVYVCYRIHIPGLQPAGYYFNNLKYTAVAKF